MDVLLSAERIQARVDELARQIAEDYHGQPLTIIGVLTGSLIFLSDLVRRLDLPLRIGLIQASSYRGASTSPGQLHVHPELDRKSTRLNSSHITISYAVFCLKKKKTVST